MNLYSHLPTSFIPETLLKKMIKSLDLLNYLGKFITGLTVGEHGLKEVINECVDMDSRSSESSKLIMSRKDCLRVLWTLHGKFSDFNNLQEYNIRRFCLENACLLFCTASSSAKLHMQGIKRLELLVVDEAAQLKECESTIPLQLCGINHAILIGDEKQLPAVVKSKVVICDLVLQLYYCSSHCCCCYFVIINKNWFSVCLLTDVSCCFSTKTLRVVQSLCFEIVNRKK